MPAVFTIRTRLAELPAETVRGRRELFSRNREVEPVHGAAFAFEEAASYVIDSWFVRAAEW